MADATKLVDMAYTKAELKEEKAEAMSGYPSPYPWGLCLSLEKDELSKLGIKTLPNVGDEWHLLAVAKVTGVNQSARENEDEETRVGLQITMMQVILQESAAEEKREKETPAAEARETTKPRKGGVLGT
jgi:hypothetical protein